MFQAPLRTLIDLNRLSPPFTLSPGQVLSLPKPNFHTVDKGETLIAIAGRFNVDARSLALLNRMAPPYTLRAGDRLVLPALARASVAPSAAPPSRTPPRATPKPGPGAEPPPKPTIKFAWPLRGQILARFGPQDGGRRSDGVEIAGSEGAKVAAAAAGKVIYAGDDLPGYGNLVLVQHPGGWVTAYAHARTLLAKEGQQVAQGQPIAELGARAGGSPRLLFQIRQGAAPADPLPLLPPT
jgi:murein DD-endopeptidase MepM/ murein hydrolase activator NlpD